MAKKASTMPSISVGQFTPTKWDSAKQKAKFVKHFLRFVEKDFPESLFYRWFYEKLSNTFGHIAHYNRRGFYSTFFTNARDKIRFLQITLSYPCYGDPTYTYSDAEKVIQDAVRAGNYLARYEDELAKMVEESERTELARLKAKYES